MRITAHLVAAALLAATVVAAATGPAHAVDGNSAHVPALLALLDAVRSLSNHPWEPRKSGTFDDDSVTEKGRCSGQLVSFQRRANSAQPQRGAISLPLRATDYNLSTS